MAVDANFSQRHAKSSGETPSFYDPKYFISKAKVDAVGERITAARKRPARRYTSKLPEEAVDACERSFLAADESAAKTKGSKFDDTGLTALVCRHDIPLFLCNVDTPGEQQKYSITLVEELFENIPDTATVTVLYDIGCVLDRSIQKVGSKIYPASYYTNSPMAFSIDFLKRALSNGYCGRPPLCTPTVMSGCVS